MSSSPPPSRPLVVAVGWGSALTSLQLGSSSRPLHIPSIVIPSLFSCFSPASFITTHNSYLSQQIKWVPLFVTTFGAGESPSPRLQQIVINRNTGPECQPSNNGRVEGNVTLHAALGSIAHTLTRAETWIGTSHHLASPACVCRGAGPEWGRKGLLRGPGRREGLRQGSWKPGFL